MDGMASAAFTPTLVILFSRIRRRRSTQKWDGEKLGYFLCVFFRLNLFIYAFRIYF